jgi:folate-binding protein YgfZ
MPTVFLPQRSIINISGEDAIEFLQGLISNDARPLEAGKAVYAAMLTPQGKFLHDFFLVPWQGKILVDIYSPRSADFLNRLKIYRLRSKVAIELNESLSAFALWGGELEEAEQEDYKIYRDPRLDEMGFRAIGAKDAMNDFSEKYQLEQGTQDEYESLRIALGVPDTRDMIIEKSLLLEYGFEQLHGLDFSKGCYVGQEVTARSKFRGQVRKPLYMVSSDSNLPEIGTQITAGDKSIGELRTSLGGKGMALVNREAYEEAEKNGIPLLCGGIKISLALPEWMKNINI